MHESDRKKMMKIFGRKLLMWM